MVFIYLIEFDFHSVHQSDAQ